MVRTTISFTKIEASSSCKSQPSRITIYNIYSLQDRYTHTHTSLTYHTNQNDVILYFSFVLIIERNEIIIEIKLNHKRSNQQKFGFT